MHEIICPHCSKAFKIDEAGYADILKQVRDGEFEQALHERLELAEREKHNAIALAKAEVTNALQKAAAAKDTEIQALKAQLDAGEVARKRAVAGAQGAAGLKPCVELLWLLKRMVCCVTHKSIAASACP